MVPVAPQPAQGEPHRRINKEREKDESIIGQSFHLLLAASLNVPYHLEFQHNPQNF